MVKAIITHPPNHPTIVPSLRSMKPWDLTAPNTACWATVLHIATPHWKNLKLGLHAKRMAQQNRLQHCSTSFFDSLMPNQLLWKEFHIIKCFMSLHPIISSCAPSILKTKKKKATGQGLKRVLSSTKITRQLQVWHIYTSIAHIRVPYQISMYHIHKYIYIYTYVTYT